MAGPFRRTHRFARAGAAMARRKGCDAGRRPAAGAAAVEGESAGGNRSPGVPSQAAYAGSHLIVLSMGDAWN